MPSEYLASAQISAIRDLGMLPAGGETETDAILLAHMNRESRGYLTKLLMSVREGYQVASVDLPIVAGQLAYRIPSRAVGAKLKLVQFVDDDDAVATVNPMPFENGEANGLLGGGGGYYLQGNSIVLASSSSAGSTLRLTYFRRMNKIVASTAAAEISLINTATKAVTLTSPPATFTSSATYDFVQGLPHFDTLGADLAATIAGSVLTFAAALPDGLAVGDYVALAGQTPIPQAPLELHDVLAMRATFVYLFSLGNPKAQAAEKMLEQAKADALELISPRVEGSPAVIKNFYAPGWGRSRQRWGR